MAKLEDMRDYIGEQVYVTRMDFYDFTDTGYFEPQKEWFVSVIEIDENEGWVKFEAVDNGIQEKYYFENQTKKFKITI